MLYRLHWRLRRGRDLVLTWREVDGARVDVVSAALVAAAAASDGTVRLTVVDAEGRPGRAVVAGDAEIRRWRPHRRLPRAVQGEWSRRIASRHARVANFAKLVRVLGRFREGDLLDARQADMIAREVSLALDGSGAFARNGSGLGSEC